MVYYQSIDLDNVEKSQLLDIIQKIKKQPCNKNIICKDSSTKGYHLLLTCNKKCDICRLVFDDQKRYEMDINRDSKFQNIIFDKKEFFTGNFKTLNLNCERCKLIGQDNQLTKKDLTKKQLKNKQRQMKIFIPILLLELKYIYFECPNCGWGKFILTKEVKKKL